MSGSLDPPLGTPSLPIREVDAGVAARRQVSERLLPNQRAGEAIGRKVRGKRLGAEKKKKRLKTGCGAVYSVH